MRDGRRSAPDLSTWGSVRRWEATTRHELRQRHALWLHGWCIGLLVVAAMWAAAHLQLVLGSDSLALRYLVTLGIGYLAFLLVLRWWAGLLVRKEDHDGFDAGIDVPNFGGGHAECTASEVLTPLDAGGGGDFGGGGAEASFEVAGDTGSVVGDVASGALEAVGSADEGAVVVIPVAAVFLMGALAIFGAGWLMLVFFGWEVLMAVAVELAFGYVSGRTAVRIAREGWLSTAVRLTWKPLLGALACAVLLGALLDWFVPQARSLPHAVQLIKLR